MLPLNPLLHATAPAGPHLPVALLRQYAAGTLAPAAQHRVEAHTLACPRCTDLLEGFLQTTSTTTDQALAKLQQQLRQRVAQQAAPARQMRALRHPRWLVLQLAVAAALLLGLVAGGWWAWQQRRAAGTATSARAGAPAAALPPAPAAKSVAAQPLPPIDSAAFALKAPAAASSAQVCATAMPAAPRLTPAPAGGYAALRKQLRREAAGFVPAPPNQPLSGAVQLRVTIGVDGKIQKITTLRGLRADYDAEAQRLVYQGPAWVPDVSGGRRAAQTVDLAVPF